MNLSFHIDDHQQVRLGLGRTLMRARMDDMRASMQFGFNPSFAGNDFAASQNYQFSPWSANGGNPALKPYLADAVDLSYEHYFAKDAYVSLAGYYKHLETFVFNTNSVFDFTGFPYSVTPILFKGLLNQPEDIGGGYIRGVEFAASTPFRIISPHLEGFGAE